MPRGAVIARGSRHAPCWLWEANKRPGQNSLGLLPSGSDPVGETPVRCQPPVPTIASGLPPIKRQFACIIPAVWAL